MVVYLFKPFDIRLAYLDADIAPLFSRPAPDLLRNSTISHNEYIVVRETGDSYPSSPPLMFSRLVCDYHSLVVEAKHIPLFLVESRDGTGIAQQIPGIVDAAASSDDGLPFRSNLSVQANSYLRQCEIDSESYPPSNVGTIRAHVLESCSSP